MSAHTNTFDPGAVTAVMTNPIWVVRVRMFTTQVDSPQAYRGLWRESSQLARYFQGL